MNTLRSNNYQDGEYREILLEEAIPKLSPKSKRGFVRAKKREGRRGSRHAGPEMKVIAVCEEL